MTIKTASCVVCDAGPIIHLDELDSLSLLNNFETILYIRSQLLEEIIGRLEAF